MTFRPVVCAGMISLLCGCGFFGGVKPETGAIGGEKGGAVQYVALPGQYRAAYAIDRSSNVILCAEPPPDVAMETLAKIITDLKVPAQGDLNVDTSRHETATELSGRTELIMLAREFLYRGCELAANLRASEFNTALPAASNRQDQDLPAGGGMQDAARASAESGNLAPTDVAGAKSDSSDAGIRPMNAAEFYVDNFIAIRDMIVLLSRAEADDAAAKLRKLNEKYAEDLASDAEKEESVASYFTKSGKLDSSRLQDWKSDDPFVKSRIEDLKKAKTLDELRSKLRGLSRKILDSIHSELIGDQS